MTNQNERPDEAAIEEDVRRTQDEIGETVEKLEEKLNPREIARSVMGDDGSDVARDALEVTKQNPLPVALIAVGAIWLLATSRASAIQRLRSRFIGGPAEDRQASRLRPRSAEPAPIGPPPPRGEAYDRREIRGAAD